MNQIKSRLSRDNFWNLIFWFGMVVSSSIIDLFSGNIPILALFAFLFTITLAPYFLSRLNPVIHSDKKFFNKYGRELSNNLPNSLIWSVVITVPFTVFTSFWIKDNARATLHDKMFVYTALLLFIPTLYFIYKNCPISILFNKKAWNEAVTGIKLNKFNTHHNTTSHNSINARKSLSSTNICTDPSYRGMSCNIYNSNHNK